MPTPGQLTNRPTSGIDKLQQVKLALRNCLSIACMQDFLDLDVISLCEIFRLKSHQEEVSDFSFSFGQTDVCEGLIAWVQHDLEERQQHIHTLRQYVCLHQVLLLAVSLTSITFFRFAGERKHEEEILQAVARHHQPRPPLRL